VHDELSVAELPARSKVREECSLLGWRQQEEGVLRLVAPMIADLVTLREVGLVGEARHGDESL
jgi:hypothetical protein